MRFVCFTQEIFAFLISLIFIYETFYKLRRWVVPLVGPGSVRGAGGLLAPWVLQ